MSKPTVRHFRTYSGFFEGHRAACGMAGWRRNDAKEWQDATCKACKATKFYKEAKLEQQGGEG